MKLISRITSSVGLFVALVAAVVIREKPRDDDEYWETPSESRASAAV